MSEGGQKLQTSSYKIKSHVTILKANKVDFKGKGTTRHKEGKFILLKESIHKDDIILNLYSYK